MAARAIAAGVVVGQGGTATVYAVPGDPGHVVKVPRQGRRIRSGTVAKRAWRNQAKAAELFASTGIVPAMAYVEFENGTPALVMEHGEEINGITPEQFMALEDGLLAVEDAGWMVIDDLEVHVRPNDSPFVVDLGEWRPRKPNERSDVADLLDEWAGNHLDPWAESSLTLRRLALALQRNEPHAEARYRNAIARRIKAGLTNSRVV
jgi:hypothetical protein